VSNSPAEYVEELRAQNRRLRAELIRARQEKLEAITALAQSRHKAHDYEPARPGIADVD
jgi:hypothetical protein